MTAPINPLDYKTPDSFNGSRRRLRVSPGIAGAIVFPVFIFSVLFYNMGSFDNNVEFSPAFKGLLTPIDEFLGFGRPRALFPLILTILAAYLAFIGAIMGNLLRYAPRLLLSPSGMVFCVLITACSVLYSASLLARRPFSEIDFSNCRGNDLHIIDTLTFSTAFSVFTLTIMILFACHRLSRKRRAILPPSDHS